MINSKKNTTTITKKNIGILKDCKAIQAPAKRIVTPQQKQIHAPEERNCQGGPLHQSAMGLLEMSRKKRENMKRENDQEEQKAYKT